MSSAMINTMFGLELFPTRPPKSRSGSTVSRSKKNETDVHPHQPANVLESRHHIAGLNGTAARNLRFFPETYEFQSEGRTGRHRIHSVKGWGIFNRYNGDFYTGRDT